MKLSKLFAKWHQESSALRCAGVGGTPWTGVQRRQLTGPAVAAVAHPLVVEELDAEAGDDGRALGRDGAQLGHHAAPGTNDAILLLRQQAQTLLRAAHKCQSGALLAHRQQTEKSRPIGEGSRRVESKVPAEVSGQTLQDLQTERW